jgi:hypothetical protein
MVAPCLRARGTAAAVPPVSLGFLSLRFIPFHSQPFLRKRRAQVSYKYSDNFLEELKKKQEEGYQSGKYKLSRLLNHSVPYYPHLLKKDSEALHNADPTSGLFQGY